MNGCVDIDSPVVACFPPVGSTTVARQFSCETDQLNTLSNVHLRVSIPCYFERMKLSKYISMTNSHPSGAWSCTHAVYLIWKYQL